MKDMQQSLGSQIHYQRKYSVIFERLRNEDREKFFEYLKKRQILSKFLDENEQYAGVEEKIRMLHPDIKGLKIAYDEIDRPYKIFDYEKRFLENGYQLSLRNRMNDFFLALKGFPRKAKNDAGTRFMQIKRLGIPMEKGYFRFFQNTTTFDQIVLALESSTVTMVIEVLNNMKDELNMLGLNDALYGKIRIVMDYRVCRREFQFLIDSGNEDLNGKELFYMVFDRIVMPDTTENQIPLKSCYQIELNTKLAEFVQSTEIDGGTTDVNEINKEMKIALLSYILRIFIDSGISTSIYGKNRKMDHGLITDMFMNHIVEENRNMYEIFGKS